MTMNEERFENSKRRRSAVRDIHCGRRTDYPRSDVIRECIRESTIASKREVDEDWSKQTWTWIVRMVQSKGCNAEQK